MSETFETYCYRCKIYYNNNQSCDCPTDTQLVKQLQNQNAKLVEALESLRDFPIAFAMIEHALAENEEKT